MSKTVLKLNDMLVCGFNFLIYIHQEVSLKKYRELLLECNVNYKANNFLVQQNSIENIATKGAKELCEFFEQLSGSIHFKRDYERYILNK